MAIIVEIICTCCYTFHMFTKLTRSGGHTYVQLVESYRDETGRPRQRTVSTLGRLDESGGQVDSLLKGLLRAKGMPTSMGEAPQVAFESTLALGDVWALDQIWKELGIDELAAVFRRARPSCKYSVNPWIEKNTGHTKFFILSLHPWMQLFSHPRHLRAPALRAPQHLLPSNTFASPSKSTYNLNQMPCTGRRNIKEPAPGSSRSRRIIAKS